MDKYLENKHADKQDAETRAYNLGYATFLKRLAWAIETVLVTVGLGIAFAQVRTTPDGSGFIQTFPVFGIFVIIAVIELAKIPAATVVFHMKGWRKLLPLTGLIVVSLISFETIFNGFERYAHLTTQPVSKAKTGLATLERDKTRLLTTVLSAETDGSKVAELDKNRIEGQRKSVAVYEAAAERARSNLDNEKTKELKTQLISLIDQQDSAGKEADNIWIEEQQWINERLKNDAIDAKTRGQLNRRMRAMPPRQSVVTGARVKFDRQIAKVNTGIEASITAPSPEALVILDAAEGRLNKAQDQLNTFEVEAAARAASRIDNGLAIQNIAKKRAAEIEALDVKIIAAQRLVAEKSEASQLHRWAAFVFGMDTAKVGDKQVKRTSAIFGMVLGIVGALTGASVAMYSEWFRMRGIKPKVIEKEVPVEVIVEKEVEKIVEIEVPTIKYKYVPVPIGENLEDAIDGIVQALPKEAADELRSQLAEFAKTDVNDKETSYARAA